MKRNLWMVVLFLAAHAEAGVVYSNVAANDVWDYPFAGNPGGDTFIRTFGDGPTNSRASTGDLKFDLAQAFPTGQHYRLTSAKLTIWNQASATPPNPNDLLATAPIYARNLSPYLSNSATLWTESNFSAAQQPAVDFGSVLGQGVSPDFAIGAVFSIVFNLNVTNIDFDAAIALGQLSIALQSDQVPPVLYKYYSKEGSSLSFTNLSRAPLLELVADIVPDAMATNLVAHDIWDYGNAIDPGGDTLMRVFGDGATSNRTSTGDLKFDLSTAFPSGRTYQLCSAKLTVWHQSNANPPNPNNPAITQPIYARTVSPYLTNSATLWTESNFTAAQRPEVDFGSPLAQGFSPDFATGAVFSIVFDLDVNRIDFNAAVEIGQLSVALQSDQNPGFPPTNPLYRCFTKEGSAAFFGNQTRTPRIELSAWVVPDLSPAATNLAIKSLLPSCSYTLQRSSDLTTWSNVSVFMSAGAETNYIGTAGSETGTVFYRITRP